MCGGAWGVKVKGRDLVKWKKWTITHSLSLAFWGNKKYWGNVPRVNNLILYRGKTWGNQRYDTSWVEGSRRWCGNTEEGSRLQRFKVLVSRDEAGQLRQAPASTVLEVNYGQSQVSTTWFTFSEKSLWLTSILIGSYPRVAWITFLSRSSNECFLKDIEGKMPRRDTKGVEVKGMDWWELVHLRRIFLNRLSSCRWHWPKPTWAGIGAVTFHSCEIRVCPNRSGISTSVLKVILWSCVFS